MTGKVFLIGAGPGDPGLLTMRAADLIARADFIAIDALVSDAIADRAPKTENDNRSACRPETTRSTRVCIADFRTRGI